MACAQLSWIIEVIAITFWMALFAVGMDRTDSCRPHCTGSYCVTVHRVKVDFQSADEMCRSSKGELLTLLPNDDTLHTLDYGDYGDFWIGLILPDGSCSNLSAPLRGYKWTDNSKNSSPSFNLWKDRAKVCSPSCVSTSHDLKWTERPCSQEITGFLCRTDREHACQVQGVSDFFRSTTGCSAGPCEHKCTEVIGGYRCSCFRGYAPDSEDPRRCKLHCAYKKCPLVCDVNDHSVCSCPYGYIKNENMCEDIDECEMQQCEQGCHNSNGGFRCSCNKGFALRDHVKCVKTEDSEYLDITTPIVPAFVKPAPKNRTMKGSSLSTGKFVWLWVFLAVVVIVVICVVRWYALKLQKRAQQMTVAQGVNAQC